MAQNVPIAAGKDDQVWSGKWKWKQLYKDKDATELDIDNFLKVKSKGLCVKTNEEGVEKQKSELTLKTYDFLKCNKTKSKGGYTKDELFNFGKNILGIPEIDLKESSGKKKNKEELCNIVNTKVKELIKPKNVTPKDILEAFEGKDLDNCNLGEKGGGFFQNDLQKLAILYFDMSEEEAIKLTKKELCDYIVPRVKKIKAEVESQDDEDKIIYSKIYKKNMYLCDKSSKHGGYSISKLRKLGSKYFGITDKELSKNEICKIIIKKMENQHQRLEKSKLDEEQDQDQDQDNNSTKTKRKIIKISNKSKVSDKSSLQTALLFKSSAERINQFSELEKKSKKKSKKIVMKKRTKKKTIKLTKKQTSKKKTTKKKTIKLTKKQTPKKKTQK